MATIGEQALDSFYKDSTGYLCIERGDAA